MFRYDPLHPAYTLPDGVPREQDGFRGDVSCIYDGGNHDQEGARLRLDDQEERRGGPGGGRDGSLNSNFNHGVNTPHVTPNAYQQSPTSITENQWEGIVDNGPDGSPEDGGSRVDFNNFDRPSGLPPLMNNADFAPAIEAPAYPPAEGGVGGRGWGDHGSAGGWGAGPNTPQLYSTRSVRYSYNATRSGHPNRGGRGGRPNGVDEDKALRRLGADFNPHLRKIKFVKSSVVLFHDQEEIFKPEVAEIDVEDPHSTADRVDAVFRHDEESSDSGTNGDGVAGDISFATPPLEKEDDELTEATSTSPVDSLQDVILSGSSQLQIAKTVETIASSTTIVAMETTTTTFTPSEDLSDLLSSPLPVAAPVSPAKEVMIRDETELWEDGPSSKEDVEKPSRRVDEGKQCALENEDVIGMLDEDGGEEEAEEGEEELNLGHGFFTANEKSPAGGEGRGNLMPSKHMIMDDPMLDTAKHIGHAPDSVPPKPEAQCTQDQEEKAVNERWRAEERVKLLATVAATGGKKQRKEVIAAVIKEYVEDDQWDTLELLSLSKSERKKMNKIATTYSLESVHMGTSKNQITTLSKTPKIGMEDGGLNKVQHREGDIVSQHAAKIDESNAGYRLLQAMGWSAGDKIGITGGLETPLEAVFKLNKLGLGAVKKDVTDRPTSSLPGSINNNGRGGGAVAAVINPTSALKKKKNPHNGGKPVFPAKQEEEKGEQKSRFSTRIRIRKPPTKLLGNS